MSSSTAGGRAVHHWEGTHRWKKAAMPILELPVTVLGRRLRPVALGLSIWCAAVLWADHADGVQSSEVLVILACTVALVVFVVGWFMRSTRLEEAGLLLVVFASLSNTMQVWFTLGPQPRILVSLAVAIIAAGSFFLERLDPATDRAYRRPVPRHG